MFKSLVGVPWEPEPGRTGEIRSDVRLTRATEGVPELVATRPPTEPRAAQRPSIVQQDVIDFGPTPGCKRCSQAEMNFFVPGVKPTDACRERFAKLWQQTGDTRHEELANKYAEAGWEEIQKQPSDTRVEGLVVMPPRTDEEPTNGTAGAPESSEADVQMDGQSGQHEEVRSNTYMHGSSGYAPTSGS